MVITSSLRPSFRKIINHYKTFNIHARNFITPMSFNKLAGGPRSTERNLTLSRRKRKENKQNKTNVKLWPARRGACAALSPPSTIHFTFIGAVVIEYMQ